jgi:hypothetical protein
VATAGAGVKAAASKHKRGVVVANAVSSGIGAFVVREVFLEFYICTRRMCLLALSLSFSFSYGNGELEQNCKVILHLERRGLAPMVLYARM